ncbi:superoxide dismutase family protein [Priestia megaterium]|nr:superoxide dismutase family protein [Priestia megaterium]
MKKLLLASCIPFVFVAGCMEKEVINKEVEVYNRDGDSLGTVKLKEQSDGVEITYKLEGLPPGEHGVHIHEKGICKAPSFKTAGNHLNPDQKKHGLLNPEGAHAGDLKNIIAKDDGTFDGKDVVPEVTMKEGKGSLIKRMEGSSIIITEKKDDGMTQPAGDSGSRIACGIISKDQSKK